MPEWDGNEKTYGRHKRKIAGYKRTHKAQYMDGKFFTMPDPRNRDRVTRRRRATADDPTGTKEGDWVEAESEEEYADLCQEYVECLGAWFDVLAASLDGGKAEEKAEEMLAAENQDGNQLEQELDHLYETKSSKNMAGMFLTWITTEKPHDVPTEEWVPQWNNTRKIIEKNMDWQTMRTYIFMKLLGPTNNQFYKIETSKEKLPELADIQSKAEDWDRDNRREGEGKPHQVALMAQQKPTSATTRGTGRTYSTNNNTDIPFTNSNHPDWLTVPCVACPHKNKSKHFHCMRDCFDGGLSHLTDDEKDAWLAMKRQAKEQRHRRNSNNTNTDRPWRKRQRDQDEQANLAEENRTLRQKLKQQERTEAGFAKIAEKAREHGLEHEFDPLVDETRGVFYLSQKTGH